MKTDLGARKELVRVNVFEQIRQSKNITMVENLPFPDDSIGSMEETNTELQSKRHLESARPPHPPLWKLIKLPPLSRPAGEGEGVGRVF
jgi:hypothetical protein